MEATEILVLYIPLDLSVIGQVEIGENYYVPDGVEVYVGTLTQFLNLNPEYNKTTDL